MSDAKPDPGERDARPDGYHDPARTGSPGEPAADGRASAREEIDALRRQLGRELAAWRARAGLTQQEVASRAGYSRSTVASAEAGDPVSTIFWTAADRAVSAGGSLATSHAQTEAAIRTIRRRARAARGPAARPGMTAALPEQGAVAAQDVPCPYCGRSVTTIVRVSAALIPQIAGTDPDDSRRA